MGGPWSIIWAATRGEDSIHRCILHVYMMAGHIPRCPPRVFACHSCVVILWQDWKGVAGSAHVAFLAVLRHDHNLPAAVYR